MARVMSSATPVRRAVLVTSIVAAAMAAAGSAAAHETPCEPCAPLAPVAATSRSTDEWAPPDVAPGTDLTTSGYVGVGILTTGLLTMVVGTAMFASVSHWSEGSQAEEIAWSGGVAGAGLLLAAVGATLVVYGQEESTTIAVGPTGISARGRF
jgi:hypothetical protein